MSISIQSGVSSAYVNMSARYLQSQVTLSGSSDSVTSAVSSNKNGSSGNLAGKLNSLEHSATTNTRPLFLKGVIKQLTGVKVSGVEIDSSQLDRSTLALDASQANLEVTDNSASYSSESLSIYSKSMSLDVQGTITTKSGDSLGFNMQIDSGKLAATYSGINCQSSSVVNEQTSEVANNLDVTA